MSFPAVSSPVSSRCPACGAKINPRWPACLACRHVLRDESEPSQASGLIPMAQLAAPTPGVDAILGMPLEDFGRRHLALRVRLPDGSTCWFVSGADEVVALRTEGIPRGSIWTARELAAVLGDGWTRETIGRLIAVKREFNGPVEPAATPPAETTQLTDTTKGYPCCGSSRFWRSIHGGTFCPTCHPPAHPDLITEWIEAPDA